MTRDSAELQLETPIEICMAAKQFAGDYDLLRLQGYYSSLVAQTPYWVSNLIPLVEILLQSTPTVFLKFGLIPTIRSA